jgi:hypothetical protein
MPDSDTEFFVLCDYGQGGAWVIIAAESAEQIRGKYPMLQVFEEAPPMLDSVAIAAIRDAGVQHIDPAPAGWLAELSVR